VLLYTFIHHDGSIKQRKNTKYTEDGDRQKDKDKTQHKLKQTNYTHTKPY